MEEIMIKLEQMEKRLHYLEGKEAEREAERQRWINEGGERRGTIANDGSITIAQLADFSVTTARLSQNL